jgi:hypothetical protein
VLPTKHAILTPNLQRFILNTFFIPLVVFGDQVFVQIPSSADNIGHHELRHPPLKTTSNQLAIAAHKHNTPPPLV